MSVTDVTDTSAIQPLINQFDDYIKYDNEYNHSHEYKHFHRPTIAELDHFKKSWFYDDWCVRFRKLNAFNALGTKGVIALPNTTFEEWLYWFQEWAIAWMDDYNQFKKMVYEALQLIEKHLEAIDKTLEDHEKRIEKNEDEIQDIYKKIQEIYNRIKDLQNQIDNNYNDENNKIKNLQNQIDNNYHDENNKIKNLQNQIDALKLDLAPQYTNINADNEGAQNGWHTNDQAKPNQFHIEYRWANSNDHTQGLYMRFSCNRVYNDNFNPNSDLNGHLLMSVDLTNFINETHAQLPHAPGIYGWVDAIGSYWNNQQRAGLQYQWQMDGNTMNMYITSLYGVASMMSPGRYETEGGSTEWYVPTK